MTRDSALWLFCNVSFRFCTVAFLQCGILHWHFCTVAFSVLCYQTLRVKVWIFYCREEAYSRVVNSLLTRIALQCCLLLCCYWLILSLVAIVGKTFKRHTSTYTKTARPPSNVNFKPSNVTDLKSRAASRCLNAKNKNRTSELNELTRPRLFLIATYLKIYFKITVQCATVQ